MPRIGEHVKASKLLYGWSNSVLKLTKDEVT